MDTKAQFVTDILAQQSHLSDDEKKHLKNTLDICLQPYALTMQETLPALNTEDSNQKYLKMFLAAKLVKGCSHNTIEAYSERLSIFFKFIQKDCLEIKSSDIRYFLAYEETQRGLSKKTCNLALGAIKSFYAFLQAEEILLANPASKIDPIKVPYVKRKAFTDEDIGKLRSACRTTRERLLVEGLLSTGCRISEFVSIKREEISGDAILVHGKGGKDRYVYLNAAAQDLLESYLSQRNDDNPYLFQRATNQPQHTGNHVTTRGASGVLTKIGTRAGVENVHPHRFRRTFATNALRNGMPIEKVSLLLGHSDVGVTQRYLDIREDELREAHKKYVV